ncbi:hypothetical protein EV424DRAFT_425700 [Suillus variegatus]|nr:hypothetical protein EV424DRAFT_425700 [Suillus variegatus]
MLLLYTTIPHSLTHPSNMTFASNDPSYWLYIDLDIFVSYLTVAAGVVVVYDWGEQDSVRKLLIFLSSSSTMSTAVLHNMHSALRLAHVREFCKSLNRGLDRRFGSPYCPNFEPDFGQVRNGSGSNRGSGPDLAITTRMTQIDCRLPVKTKPSCCAKMYQKDIL